MSDFNFEHNNNTKTNIRFLAAHLLYFLSVLKSKFSLQFSICILIYMYVSLHYKSMFKIDIKNHKIKVIILYINKKLLCLLIYSVHTIFIKFKNRWRSENEKVFKMIGKKTVKEHRYFFV